MIFQTDLLLSDFESLNWLLSKRVIQLFSVFLGLFFAGILLPKLGMTPLLIGITILIIAVALIVGRLYVKWRSKTIYNRASVSAQLQLSLSETGIVQKGDSGETELLWQDVFCVRKNKLSYFVFLNPKQAFYFQKRNFQPGQEETFLKLIKQHVDPKKIKL